ncbi:AAEL011170-PA [Aedes aegypti]|uniref:AAEL011170-PA n=1 Tax=Aedes aegypti TaxID=7159 RepID=Q16QU7_AEDAE|nr:AAEL011170-PA [Aedes aegypti]
MFRLLHHRQRKLCSRALFNYYKSVRQTLFILGLSPLHYSPAILRNPAYTLHVVSSRSGSRLGPPKLVVKRGRVN